MYGFVQCHLNILLWKIKISFPNSKTNYLLIKTGTLTVVRNIYFQLTYLLQIAKLRPAKYACSNFAKLTSRENK